MFEAELWQFFGIIVVPLIGIVFGGVTYWLRKLDDRQYQFVMNSVSKTDHVEALRQLNERISRLEGRLDSRPSGPPPVSRWRNS